MKTLWLAIMCLALIIVTHNCKADAKVDEQAVAPIDPDYKYVVSHRGVHLAAVVRKGNRWEVVVDGVAGPRIEAVVTPSAAWIDSRPYQNTGSVGPVGRRLTDQITVQPVVFNRDGTHFAYLARDGDNWVLYVDHKELMRIPAAGVVGATAGIAGSAGNTDIRMQFAGAQGEQLLFAKSSYQGYELWVDGKKWPGFYASVGSGLETSEPLISPDGTHIAYCAQIDREHRGLVIDGKVADYYGEKLTYTSDSKHLICESVTPKETRLLMDGKELFAAKELITYYCAPVTNRIAAVLIHRYPDSSQGQFLLVDNKPVDASLCRDGIQTVVFSPDGRHYAAICKEGPNFYVVTDGKKGENYDLLGISGAPLSGIGFSPDSSRLVYVAHGGGKYFIVVNGEESDTSNTASITKSASFSSP